MNIMELAERRAAAFLRYNDLGMMNVSPDPTERVKQDVLARLARDAWQAAEQDYQAAIASMTTPELMALASGG